MAHQELGKEVIARFQEACAEVSSVDKKPALEGRQMIMFLTPLKPGKNEKAEKPAKAEDAAE
jgi:translation initiation factor IF-3